MHAQPIPLQVPALFVIAASLAFGCAARPRTAPTPSDQPAPLAMAPAQPADPADPVRSQDLLVEQAAAYAAKLEQALAERAAAQENHPAVPEEHPAAPEERDPAAPKGLDAAAPAAGSSATTRPTDTDPSDAGPSDAGPSDADPSDAAAGTDPVDHAPVRPQGEAGAEAALPPGLPDSADELVNRTELKTRETPTDLLAHLERQLLLFLREEKVPQMSEIASLPAEDRELLAALLESLTVLRNNLRRDGDMLQPEKIQPLLDLATRLRTQAELVIPTIALCKKVKTFGVYEPTGPEFAAGSEHPVIVYCEVENFASQLNDKKMWETRLKQEIVLYTEGGLPVWQNKTRTVIDLSRNRRRDFFVVDMVKLPANLTIGRYLLKASLVDLNANRIAEATVPLAIVAREARGE